MVQKAGKTIFLLKNHFQFFLKNLEHIWFCAIFRQLTEFLILRKILKI